MRSVIRNLVAAGCIASAALASLPAFAQDSGFYVGGAVGQAKFKQACDGSPIPCDDKDTSWKILGGYQINKHFGVEFGYVDFGKASAAGTVAGIPVAVTAKANAWEFLGVGTLPFANNLSAYAKAGFARWDVDTSATAGGVSAAIGDRGTDFTFGLGLKYNFTKNLAARVEWQRYNNVGNDATTGQSDIDKFSIGIIFKF